MDHETICNRPDSFEPRLHGVRASTVQTENRDHLVLMGAALCHSLAGLAVLQLLVLGADLGTCC